MSPKNTGRGSRNVSTRGTVGVFTDAKRNGGNFPQVSEDLKPFLWACLFVIIGIAGIQWFGLIVTPGGF